MPRLLGVEIPAEKRIEASLTYIYGIGFSTARKILEQTNIDPNLRANKLSPQQINEIIHAITNNKIKIEGDLRRDIQGKDRKSTRLNSSHLVISYAVFCLKKKKTRPEYTTHTASGV